MQQNRLLSKRTAYPIFILTGFLFVFCLFTGKELASEGNILWSAGYTAKLTGGSLLLGGALGSLICLFFYKAAQKMQDPPCITPQKENVAQKSGFLKKLAGQLWKRVDGGSRRKAGRVFAVSLLLDFLAWLPAFLAYYPAICAYDMPIQMGQVASGRYIDHHPIAHTLLLKVFVQLGERVFGNVNTGIGCYAVFQMLLLAASFALGMYCLYRHGIRRLFLLLVQAFGMWYPFHLYMSVSVTKDTVFSAFFLITLLALSEIAAGRRAYEPLFILGGLGTILFRNNGKYAYLVLLVFLLVSLGFGKAGRAFWGRTVLLAGGIFLVGNLLLSGIFKVTHAEQGDKREMLCMPIQQLSRVMLYHGGVGAIPEDDGAMPEKDRALINDFILDEGYRSYRADFTDPVKSHTNTYVARYRPKEFLATYVGLFLRFPGDYLNAALAVNAGYLYPGDVTHAVINAQEGQEAGGGYVQTRWDTGTLQEHGITKDSQWPALWEHMEEWADSNAYLKMPVLKYIFVPGVWVWLYLLLLEWLLIRRRFAECIPLTLVFGYFLTLFLGPTVQLRYLYPVMAAFPFLTLLSGDKQSSP